MVVVLEFSNAYSFLECDDNSGGVTDVVGEVLLFLATVGDDGCEWFKVGEHEEECNGWPKESSALKWVGTWFCIS